MSLILSGSNGVSDIDGDASTPAIRGTDANTGIFFGADTIGFSEGGVEAMRLDSSGNLLVGQTTNSQNYRFVIKGSAGTADDLAMNTDGTKTEIQSFNAKPLYLNRQGNNVIVCAGGDNFLVGTTSVIGGDGAILNVNSPAAIATLSATTATSAAIGFHNPNGRVGYIGVSGSATSYNTGSDYRLKNTIAPMTGALAKVAQLKPVTYKWNASGSDGEGFIAHELAEICPSAVSGQKDAIDENGNPQYQGVDTSFLVATLTAAIQEQQALITQLQADVAALKAV